MAKCHTCGKVVDTEATVCPGCGRPNPTKMRQGEAFGGAIGLIVVIIIIFASGGGSHGSKASQLDQTNPPVASTSLAPTRSDVAPSGSFQQADQGVITGESQASQPTEDTMSVAQEASTTGIDRNDVQSDRAGVPTSTNPQFPYKAYVIDSRGNIVVQGGPSIFYKNVEILRSGDSVWAASKNGKWISVQLLDGNIGYVRQKQLEFQN